MLFNPGGPGGSGFDPIAVSGSVHPERARASTDFDIVGFDPRGVDRSDGIKCVDDAFQDAHLYLDDTPDTPEEQALLDEADQGFIDGCKEQLRRHAEVLFHRQHRPRHGSHPCRPGRRADELPRHLATAPTSARVYATLFPERVRAMVLDSAYEPNGDTVEQQYLTQLVGFEGAFNDWATWCEGDDDVRRSTPPTWAPAGTRCACSSTRTRSPATTAASGNQSTLDVATTAALYSESEWPVLAERAGRGRGRRPRRASSRLADDYNGRNADGTFNTLFQSIGIIPCASGIATPPPDDPEALLAKIKEQAPRFGADVTLDDLTDTDGDDCERPDWPDRTSSSWTTRATGRSW